MCVQKPVLTACSVIDTEHVILKGPLLSPRQSCPNTCVGTHMCAPAQFECLPTTSSVMAQTGFNVVNAIEGLDGRSLLCLV